MNQENEDQHIPLADYEQNNISEPIQEIIDHRKKQQAKQEKKQALEKLRLEREELQIAYNTRKEKERIDALKNKLDGKIYCDHCGKWVYNNHFNLSHLYKGKVFCDDCKKWVYPSHFD